MCFFIRKELHVINVFKYGCPVNSSLRSWLIYIKESQQTYKDVWNIINEYDEKEQTKIVEKVNDELNELKMNHMNI